MEQGTRLLKKANFFLDNKPMYFNRPACRKAGANKILTLHMFQPITILTVLSCTVIQ